MPGKALTGEVMLKVGPVVVETLVKHYFEGIKKTIHNPEDDSLTKLRKDELLYDEAFNVARVCSSSRDA